METAKPPPAESPNSIRPIQRPQHTSELRSHGPRHRPAGNLGELHHRPIRQLEGDPRASALSFFVRFVLLGVLSAVVLLTAQASDAQPSEERAAKNCETYYRFEIRIIDEQKAYAIQAAVGAVEERAPGEKTRLIEEASGQASKRFDFDLAAARRALVRCLARRQ